MISFKTYIYVLGLCIQVYLCSCLFFFYYYYDYYSSSLLYTRFLQCTVPRTNNTNSIIILCNILLSGNKAVQIL